MRSIADYAWIIDIYHLGDEEAGIIGPGNSEPENSMEFETYCVGKLVYKFRMYDDDGILYYSGRLAYPLNKEISGFVPLDDFGLPNAGCTEIRYLKNGQWVSL